MGYLAHSSPCPTETWDIPGSECDWYVTSEVTVAIVKPQEPAIINAHLGRFLNHTVLFVQLPPGVVLIPSTSFRKSLLVRCVPQKPSLPQTLARETEPILRSQPSSCYTTGKAAPGAGGMVWSIKRLLCK